MSGSWVDPIINGIKSKLKIQSPSQVFVEIGENIGQGLIVGIGNMQSGVMAAMESKIIGPIKKGADDIKNLLKEFSGRLHDIYTPAVTATDKALDLLAAMAAQGKAVSQTVREWVLYRASLVDAAEAISKMTRPRSVTADKTRERLTIIGQMLKADLDAAQQQFEELVDLVRSNPTITRPRRVTEPDVFSQTRPRRVGTGDAEESPLLRGLRDTARQVTDIFRGAVSAGIHGGFKEGIKTLLSRFADLLKQFGERLMDKLLFEPLEKSLSDWLIKVAGSGTGVWGGVFGKIFGGNDAQNANTVAIRDLSAKVMTHAGTMIDSIGKTIVDTATTSINSGSTSSNTAALIANTAALKAATASMSAGGKAGESVGSIAGLISKMFAGGGFVSGRGGPTSDLIPAWLSNGEFVIQAAAVQRFGRRFFEGLNSGLHIGPRFAYGGMPNAPAMTAPRSGDTFNFQQQMCPSCRGAFRPSQGQLMSQAAAHAARARHRLT
jgi:hypothetical protein